MSFLKNIPLMVANDIRQRLGGAFGPNAKMEVLKIGAPSVLIPEYTTAYNTAMLVNIDDAYQQWLVYNRVDATTYFSKFWSAASARGVMYTKPAIDTYGALDDINKFLVTDFVQEEIYNDPITAGDTVTIRFTDKCRWFTGQVVLPVEAKSRVVNGKVVAKASYSPNIWRGAVRTQDKINPGILTYSSDYDTTTLLSIPQSTVFGSTFTTGLMSAGDTTTLAAFLKAKDGLPWQSSTTASEFNVYGGVMLFNGNALDFNIARMLSSKYAGDVQNDTLGLLLSEYRLPRLTRRYLAVVMINPTYCTNLDRDLLFIHYGPAIDITAIDSKVDPVPVHHWPLEGNFRNYGSDSKKPEFAVRGSFQSQRVFDSTVFLQVHKDTNQTITGSPLGAELPINKDFTFSFKFMIGPADFALGDAAVQFYQLSKQTGATSGRIMPIGGLFTVNTSDTGNANSAKNGVFSDTKSWPHGVTVTIVREGDEWSVYHDGMLRSNFRNIVISATMLDALYCGYDNFFIKDVRYYDTALTPTQIKRMVSLDTKLAGPVYQINTAVPEPKYHYPLNNNLFDSNGQVEFISTNKSTAKFTQISYREITIGYYYNTASTPSQLSTPFPRNADFTLQWEFYRPASVSGAGPYNLWCDAASTQVNPIVTTDSWAKHNGPMQFNRNTWNQLPGGVPYRWTLVRRGRVFYWYLNTKFVGAELIPEGTSLLPLTHFLSPGYNISGTIRNVKYWDIALTEDQVIASKEPL